MELTAFIRDKGNLEPYIDWDYPALAKDTFIKLIGKGVKVKVTRRNKPVTHPQFEYLYGAVYPLVKEWVFENWGEDIPLDDVDIMFKMQFWYVGRGKYKIPRSKTEMSTVDMNNYQENIRRACAIDMGLNVPEPNKKWRETKGEAE